MCGYLQADSSGWLYKSPLEGAGAYCGGPILTENKEVSYTANRSRVSIRGRPCKNLPHIWFDHQAEFVFFSYCMHACTRPWQLGDAGPPYLWDVRSWPTPRNMLLHRICYHAIFRRSGSNLLGVGRRSQFFGDAGVGSRPFGRGSGLPSSNYRMCVIVQNL